MRIEWGYRTETVPVGPWEAADCPSCKGRRAFTLLLRYRCRYVFDPSLCWVSDREYFGTCEGCGKGTAVDAKAAVGSLSKDPVPWKHRRGLLVGATAIATVALIVILIIRASSLPAGR